MTHGRVPPRSRDSSGSLPQRERDVSVCPLCLDDLPAVELGNHVVNLTHIPLVEPQRLAQVAAPRRKAAAMKVLQRLQERLLQRCHVSSGL